MTEALTEIVRWALAQPAIFRIGAVCDVENVRSARVMEKAGLIREGVLRRFLIHPASIASPGTVSAMLASVSEPASSTERSASLMKRQARDLLS